MKVRQRFSEEYKSDAVRMVLENGIRPVDVVKDLGIGRSTLEKWIRDYKRKFSAGNGVPCPVEGEELRQLKAENHKLRLERELLKKAAIFFANDRSS